MDFTRLKQLFTDEDAVSPVIGVILMVAITVILAAVIGTFVLGLGENVQDSAPQANFQFEYEETTGDAAADADTVTITHTGGEDVSSAQLSVIVEGDTTYDGNTVWGGGTETTVNTGVSGSITFGDGFTGNNVRVVWTSPSGGTSNTIGQSSVPS